MCIFQGPKQFDILYIVSDLEFLMEVFLAEKRKRHAL